MPRRTRFTALLAIASVVAVACSGAESTEPNILNLHAAQPTGWFVINGGPTYVVGLDNHTVHGGRASLAIAGTDADPNRFSGVGQAIKADAYRDKRVRFRAWVRQSSIAGSDIGIWMRIDGPGVLLGFDNFSSRPLVGTSDWHQVEIILDIPHRAIGIAFGALMSGLGEFFVDDMTIEVIPANGPTTNLLIDFPVSGDSATTATNYAAGPVAPSNLNFEVP